MKQHPVLFLFVDGLGLGPEDPAINPIFSGCSPCLANLLKSRTIPIDAGMGVPGRPQSATGQAALFTGVNTAALTGHHIEGFPGPTLKTIIHEHNLYRRLAALKRKSTFANAYFINDVKEVEQWRHQSVTTVAALDAFGTVRNREQMEKNDAVYQDIVREELRARGYTGPGVEPADAARHLLTIARRHDFTVFEYFQTDRAAHAQDPVAIQRVLSIFDQLLAALLPPAEAGELLLLLTSDHGNIEDLRERGHTMNPVPLIAVGPGANFFQSRIRSITDFTPALLEWFESQ